MKKVLLISLIGLFFAASCGAQETGKNIKEEEKSDYTYGSVVEIKGSEIVISEYDFDKDEEVSMTYTIDPKAELRNVKSLSEIMPGDSVDITFIIKDGKKIATIIDVAKPVELKEGPMPEEPAPGEQQ